MLKDYNVFEAENGQQALHLVMTSNVVFDMIFSDIRMPIMDGMEFTRLVRNLPDETKNNIFIVGTTGSSSKIDALNCGMNVYIEKPFSKNIIISTLKNM